MLHFGRIGVPEIESLVLERFFNRRLEKVEKLIGGDGIILDYLEACCCCCWLIQINSTNVSLSFYIELPWNQLHLRFFNSTKKSSFKLMQTELQDFPRSVRIIVNLSSQNEIFFSLTLRCGLVCPLNLYAFTPKVWPLLKYYYCINYMLILIILIISFWNLIVTQQQFKRRKSIYHNICPNHKRKTRYKDNFLITTNEKLWQQQFKNKKNILKYLPK
eukprot:TRINITY_DN4590_c0_g1_i8.p2 TRINITY_DN4590_c0_g1~~TRINITY_DN4590_c0_g1_i8.p2  ORF type:complete len:217 (+),score=-8.40 TRINITY_DN4590_c0_g1_i8:752-1402(+)